jgi:hypothetical protein
VQVSSSSSSSSSSTFGTYLHAVYTLSPLLLRSVPSCAIQRIGGFSTPEQAAAMWMRHMKVCHPAELTLLQEEALRQDDTLQRLDA